MQHVPEPSNAAKLQQNVWGSWSQPLKTMANSGTMTAADKLRQLANGDQNGTIKQPVIERSNSFETGVSNLGNKTRCDSILSEGSESSGHLNKAGVKNGKKKTTGPVHNTRYKAKLCKNWMKSGSCPYFEKCQFAHGPYELDKWANRRAKAKIETNSDVNGQLSCPPTNNTSNAYDKNVQDEEEEESKTRGDESQQMDAQLMTRPDNSEDPMPLLFSPHNDSVGSLGNHLGGLSLSQGDSISSGLNHDDLSISPESFLGLPISSSTSKSPFDEVSFDPLPSFKFEQTSSSTLFHKPNPLLQDEPTTNNGGRASEQLPIPTEFPQGSGFASTFSAFSTPREHSSSPEKETPTQQFQLFSSRVGGFFPSGIEEPHLQHSRYGEQSGFQQLHHPQQSVPLQHLPSLQTQDPPQAPIESQYLGYIQPHQQQQHYGLQNAPYSYYPRQDYNHQPQAMAPQSMNAEPNDSVYWSHLYTQEQRQEQANY